MHLSNIQVHRHQRVVSTGGLGGRSVCAGLISGATIEPDFFFFLRVSRATVQLYAGGRGCTYRTFKSIATRIKIQEPNRKGSWTRLSSSWGLEKVLATWSGLKIWSVLTPESAGETEDIVGGEDGRLPAIVEDKYYPRRTLE
jgi:hypothetical protein